MVLMKALSISDASTVVLGLQDEIRRSEESRYDHRLHGVLLVAQGYSCGEVARLLGSAPRTVEYWVHRFEQWGLGGLRERTSHPSAMLRAQASSLKSLHTGGIVHSAGPSKLLHHFETRNAVATKLHKR
jgi:transposase